MHFPEDKCSVCHDPAGPHIYYGARVRVNLWIKWSHHSTPQACLPCRAFFKRSVEQNRAYICYGDSNCVVAYNGRKGCKFCRFQVRWDWLGVAANITRPSQACLRGGMKESYVLRPQRPPKARETETLNQEEAASLQRLAGISRIFDKSKIGMFSHWKMILHEIIRLISPWIIIELHDTFRWILFQKVISTQSKMFLEREMEKKTKGFLRKLPFFINLPIEDKEMILEKNVPLGVLFQKCTFFNPGNPSLFQINEQSRSPQTSTFSSSSLLCWARKKWEN